MHRIIAASLAVAGLSVGLGTAASAADLGPGPAPVYTKAPVMAPWSWTGFYIGGNAGGSWGKDKITSTSDPLGWTSAGAAAIDGASPTSLKPQGFLGGGQIGYNWQFNSFVFGLEADADWVGANNVTRSVTGFSVINSADVMTNQSQQTFLATVRPRLGVAFDHALLYGTGGLAIGTLKTNDSFGSFGNTSIAGISTSTTRTGWTAGAGLEWAFNRNWSAKVEYLHVDLGSSSDTIPSCIGCATGSDITINHKFTEEVARVGVNYLFH
jgi:outer membrane immunogenic protein